MAWCHPGLPTKAAASVLLMKSFELGLGDLGDNDTREISQ